MINEENINGWEKTTLGNIADYINGRAFKPTEWQSSGIPIIRIQNLNNENASYNYYQGDLDDKYKVKSGDLLYSWSASLDSYIWSGKDAYLNQHIFNVKPYGGIYKKFIYYLLKQISSDILGKTHGMGMVHITKGKFENIEIFLPPLNEQNRIVDKIETLFSEVDAGIENLTLAKRQLEQYRQSLLKHAFEGKLTAEWRANYKKTHGKPLPTADELLEQIQTARQDYHDQQMADWKQAVKDWEAQGKEGRKPSKSKIIEVSLGTLEDEIFKYKIPSEWSVLHLDNVLTDISAGKSFKCEEREPNEDEIGVAKISALTWGEYDESESKTCINEELVNESLFIKTNDFLLSRANTIELVGNCVIVKHTHKNIMLSDKTLRINFLEDAVSKEYVLYYLRSGFGRQEIMERSTGNQESMRNISQKSINRINIPICSYEEQTIIVNSLKGKLSDSDRLINDIDTQLKKANLLKTSILHKAFQGKLVPQDPNDAPASELLAQIKAEREVKALAEKQAKQDKTATKSKTKSKKPKLKAVKTKTEKQPKKNKQITLPL
ncbi:restriction endonuclease subunit S [uncultured Psychrobacter sp.]|uniref:restriction endonuclease subunit S n=1 Tax=uncultured Psychrobacter sp. TaxID=259303 RepID=UPI003459B548